MTLGLTSYTIRRKVFKLFGASFQIFDPDGTVVGFSRQKAFTIREDIRVYADEAMAAELLVIKARQIIDFSAAYDILDGPAGTKIGAARRKGLSSLVRDSWEILDPDDRPIARLSEDSLMLATVRRVIGGFLAACLIPQRFHLGAGEQAEAAFRVHFNPFVYRLDVAVAPGGGLDRRLVLATAVLLAAIEGRQG